MKKYAFFLDIDGTLAKGGKVHPDNVRMIREAQNMGHFVFINTGRSYGYIPSFVRSSADFDGFICGLGADVRYRGEQIFAKRMEKALLERLVSTFLAMPERVALFEGEDRVYFTKTWYDVENGVQITAPTDFTDKFPEAAISKFTCEPIDKRILEPFSGELVLYDHGSYFEMAQKGCTKAGAMLLAAEHLGIPQEHCVAMGDSINDEEMLDAAGIAVVMENGMESTKKKATFITTSAGEGGVARAIEKIIY